MHCSTAENNYAALVSIMQRVTTKIKYFGAAAGEEPSRTAIVRADHDMIDTTTLDGVVPFILRQYCSVVVFAHKFGALRVRTNMLLKFVIPFHPRRGPSKQVGRKSLK